MMKIIACLKEVIDPTLSLDAGLRYITVSREGIPLRLNPADAAALAIALELKSGSGSPVELTLLSIGPGTVESYLRNGLALGADKAVRIWEDGFNGLSSFRKAKLLAAAVSLFGADIVFTGARGLDTANGLVGPLIAARLGLPCIADVSGLEMAADRKTVIATRHVGRGEREKVGCPLPAVITVRGEGRLPCASLDSFIDSRRSEVVLLSAADLGVSAAELENDPIRVTGLGYPRPRPVSVPPLDMSLPAFDRILQLLQGGVSRRQGLMLQGTADEQADLLFRLLIEDGVLKPARDV
jgi:electron transfer flavoprotein beta subunit